MMFRRYRPRRTLPAIGRRMPAGQPGAGDVREGVEGALRHDTGDAVDGIEPADDQVATGPERLAELGHLVLRPGQGREPARWMATEVQETLLTARLEMAGASSGGKMP